jgi:benzoyl-CoA reductase/2-hydroxyglutaryl-CoA dehydratase subunit BcrC/BadD/HgdB
VGQGKPCPFNFVLENKMELAKTDYTNETELSAAREMIERRDAEIDRLRKELSQSKEDAAAQRTLNTEESILLDDIRLSLFKLLKDQLGAMVSGEIAEQLKTKETTFDIQDHMEDISEYITYNFDICSFHS